MTDRKPPTPTGQCLQFLEIIRKSQPVLSLVLTAEHAIPEAAARIHNLRNAGWNIITTIHPEIQFRGETRRNIASYHLGSPEWPSVGFPESVGDSTANRSGQNTPEIEPKSKKSVA